MRRSPSWAGITHARRPRSPLGRAAGEVVGRRGPGRCCRGLPRELAAGVRSGGLYCRITAAAVYACYGLSDASARNAAEPFSEGLWIAGRGRFPGGTMGLLAGGLGAGGAVFGFAAVGPARSSTAASPAEHLPKPPAHHAGSA